MSGRGEVAYEPFVLVRAWDAMPADEQAMLLGVAREVRILLARGDVTGAQKHLELANLDTVQKVTMWARFDTKERSTLNQQFKEQP